MGLSEQEMDEITKFVNSGIKKELPNYGFRFFTVILELAPNAKNMFSFLKDKDGLPEQEDIDHKLNSKLNSHAKSVFKNTWVTAGQLRRDGKVKLPPATPKAESFGSIHHKSGVMDHHFEVVKIALIRTIKEGMKDKWSEEVESAWSEAYDQLAAAIRAEMKQEAAKSTTTINEETDVGAIKAEVKQGSAAEEEAGSAAAIKGNKKQDQADTSTNPMFGPVVVVVVVLLCIFIAVWLEKVSIVKIISL